MSEAKMECSKCGVQILVETARRTGGLCMPCRQGMTASRMSPQEAFAELNEAATSLQSRAKILGIPTKAILLEDWQRLETGLRERVPLWFRELLARHALHGIALECRDRANKGIRIFSFQSPEELKITLTPGSFYDGLTVSGYVPVGYEQNGDLWLVESNAGIDGPVFLFEQSAWDGGALTVGNGLVFAASRLALLMASMAISELSYDEGAKRLIWFPDRL